MGVKAQGPARDGFLTWAEIAPWQRDNEFILTGYRRASFSYITSIWSIFTVHNETTNIWSHLLGALLFAGLFAHFFLFSHLIDDVRLEDRVAVGVYYMAVVMCFVLSSSFHTLSDHSPEVHRLGNELDHLGIVFVLWGTGVSAAHFAFYCHPAVRNGHLALLTAAALGCGVLTLRPRFRRPSYRPARFLVYALLGASLFVPLAQGLRRFGWARLDGMAGLGSFLGLAAVNFTGSAVYAARVPERWFPGRFDLLGQSHNWMHLLVVAGALVRLNGLVAVTRRWQAYDGAALEGFCAALG